MLYDVTGSHTGILGAPNDNVNRRPLSRHCHSSAMSIGDRIRGLREARGWSGAELARRVGIKGPSLWEIEAGETKSLRADTLMRLARVLATNPYFLWTGVGSPVAPIDPNVDEAEVVDLYRRLTAANQHAWVEIGKTLIRAQPAPAPSKLDPFPEAPKPKRSRR
jgi:transcriptional regulator with XRE-family HTH domain